MPKRCYSTTPVLPGIASTISSIVLAIGSLNFKSQRALPAKLSTRSDRAVADLPDPLPFSLSLSLSFSQCVHGRRHGDRDFSIVFSAVELKKTKHIVELAFSIVYRYKSNACRK